MGTFQPLAQRASELLADHPSLEVFAWPDQVIDSLGHDPHDSYCEQFWLPIAGPSEREDRRSGGDLCRVQLQ